jgi:hypothetical protein
VGNEKFVRNVLILSPDRNEPFGCLICLKEEEIERSWTPADGCLECLLRLGFSKLLKSDSAGLARRS